jgi:two-component system OmpR family response regulator
MDAIRQAETLRPDLIVLDVVMPDLDGFSVPRLRAGNEAVIFLTARDTSSDTVTGLALGDDYVAKPFSVEALVARVPRGAAPGVAVGAAGRVGRRHVPARPERTSRWAVHRAECRWSCHPPSSGCSPTSCGTRGGCSPRPAAGKRVGLGLRGQSQTSRPISYLRRARSAGTPLIHAARRGIHAAGARRPRLMSGSARLSCALPPAGVLIAVTAVLLIMGGVPPWWTRFG